MGTFDPATFLDTSFEEPTGSSLKPCPEGDWQAVAGEPKTRDGIGKDGRPWMALDIPWSIESEDAKRATGREKLVVNQSIMLNFTPAGRLDPDNNPAVGQIREALGKNSQGSGFSFRQVQGCVAKVKVKHRMYEGNPYAEVKGVAPA